MGQTMNWHACHRSCDIYWIRVGKCVTVQVNTGQAFQGHVMTEQNYYIGSWDDCT